ncbi:MAG: tetratricopeptide repeat protein, partial [Terriglobales bacterium]
EWGLRLGAALFRFWEAREHFTEGRDRLTRLLQLPGAAARTKERARALFSAGVLAGIQGDFVAGEPFTRESLEIARELNDKWSIAVALNALAVPARDRGDLEKARVLFEESLDAWRELGDRHAVARALSNLASVVKMQGDYARASSLYQECRAIFAELGDNTGMAWSLNHQGDVARAQGDFGAARSLYEQSLAAFRALDEAWGIAGSLVDLGNLLRDSGDHSAAHSLYAESLGIFQELGHKRGLARLLECFACSAAAQSLPERALRLAGAASAIRQTLGAPLTPAEQGHVDQSLDAARRALPGAAATAAWMEGWTMPLEKALESARVSA